MCAQIKVWILTGDKEETALNTGLSTTLITQDSSIIIFNESKLMVNFETTILTFKQF